MKLNLHCGNQILDGYENIDCRSEFADNDQVSQSLGSYFMLDLDEDSIEEIRVNTGCLESIRSTEIESTFKRWFDLLKHGSKLDISFFDIKIICNNFIYDRITIEDFEKAMTKNFRSLHDLQKVTSLCNKLGLTIQYIGTDRDIILMEVCK